MVRLTAFFLATALLSSPAHAESVAVLGRTLKVDPPPGFCLLGQSPREDELFVSKRRNLEPSGELAQFAVPCAELPEFLSGNRDHFTHWVQVLVLKRQGQLRLVRESREQFVAATAGNAANNPPDFEQVNRRIRQHLAPTGTGVVVTGTKPIGATSQAYFVEIHMAGTSNGQTVPIVTVMAVTVANQLPLAIQAYATPDAPDKPLGSIVGSYLRLILTQN